MSVFMGDRGLARRRDQPFFSGGMSCGAVAGGVSLIQTATLKERRDIRFRRR